MVTFGARPALAVTVWPSVSRASALNVLNAGLCAPLGSSSPLCHGFPEPSRNVNQMNICTCGSFRAIVSLALLGLGLVLRWPNTIPWALVFAAAGYVVTRSGESLVDGWASVVGVLLLLAAELASWSIEHDARIRTEPALVVRRAATITALAAAALLTNFILLAAAAAASSAGVLIAAAGVAAAVAAVATVLRLVTVRGR